LIESFSSPYSFPSAAGPMASAESSRSVLSSVTADILEMPSRPSPSRSSSSGALGPSMSSSTSSMASVSSAATATGGSLSRLPVPSASTAASHLTHEAALAGAGGDMGAALDAVLAERNMLSSQNAQLWKLIEKQRASYANAVKDLERIRGERDKALTKLDRDRKHHHSHRHRDRDTTTPGTPQKHSQPIADSAAADAGVSHSQYIISIKDLIATPQRSTGAAAAARAPGPRPNSQTTTHTHHLMSRHLPHSFSLRQLSSPLFLWPMRNHPALASTTPPRRTPRTTEHALSRSARSSTHSTATGHHLLLHHRHRQSVLRQSQFLHCPPATCSCLQTTASAPSASRGSVSRQRLEHSCRLSMMALRFLHLVSS